MGIIYPFAGKNSTLLFLAVWSTAYFKHYTAILSLALLLG